MKTKTFKIGEYAIGGIIKVVIHTNDIEIQCLDWTTKEKIFGQISNERRSLESELYEWTSCYWADKIMEYIELQAKEILR